MDWGHNREKLRRISRPSRFPKQIVRFEPRVKRETWYRGEMNVRKERKKFRILNISMAVNLVEFVVVSMNFARIRITIHGRVAKEPWELSVGFNAIRLQDGRRVNQFLPLSCPDTRKTRVLGINDPLRWTEWNTIITKFRLLYTSKTFFSTWRERSH